jgi:AraC-like DNA-binding protein
LSFPDTKETVVTTKEGRVESLIRASAMWGFGDLVRGLGADPEQLQRRFGISPGSEHEDDALVSLHAFACLAEACAAELDCPDFGLRLSAYQGLHILGPIAVIARNAETVRAGLGAIARYLYVHSPALKLAVEPGDEGSDVRFTYEITTLELSQAGQAYEVSMGNAVRIVRLLSGTDSGPSAISFMHDQLGPDASYAAELGCDIRFGQPWCGFEIPAEMAARPIDRADPETRRIATSYLESVYLPSSATLSERVAELARRLLPTGHCTVDEIADQLALHPRTLQRRLVEEGIRCQDLIERERRNLAARHLADPRLQLNQVASLLGYAEQSTLNRSCRRWFGKTPREYRADLAT